jgi:hypothetical protein
MHDVNGHPLKKGDKVLIPAVVTTLYGGEDYCNVSIETTLGRKPDGQKNSLSIINTAQLVKIADAEHNINLGL